MNSVTNLLREIELKSKSAKDKPKLGTIKMYNPDKAFGFVYFDDGTHVFFRRDTASKCGQKIALGLRVSATVWHIHAKGPEIKEFFTPERVPFELPIADGPLSPPVPVWPKPPEPLPAPVVVSTPEPCKEIELKDEFGTGRSRNRYPGGVEQLIIDQLKEHKVCDRNHLAGEMIKLGYNRNSLGPALSRLHARGWFIENNSKLYFRQGRAE